MSFVLTTPNALVTAASDVGDIGSTLSAVNAAATAPGTRILAAADTSIDADHRAVFSACTGISAAERAVGRVS
ncbi:PE family protein [Mycobacterium lepromatosis]